MPSFRDVVNFLNDCADVANHPFFSSSSAETKPPSSKRHDANHHRFTRLTTEGQKRDSENSNLAVTTDHKKGVLCPMCTRSHPLYRCETFKLKPSMKESSLSRPSEFASIVSILLNILQDRASLQHVARHQNVADLIILCYIFLGLAMKETLFTKPITLKPQKFQLLP